MKSPVRQLARAVRAAWRNHTATSIPHGELGELLVFGQQHAGTQSFFEKLVGQPHTVKLAKFPHYDYLQKHVDEEPNDSSLYAQYLKASWAYLYPENNPPQRRHERMRAFGRLFRDIESRRHLGADAIRVPATVCRRPDGRLIVVNGNHRASAALKVGIDLRVTFVNQVDHLKAIASAPDEVSGSARRGRPCQSVFDGDRELLRGERSDVLERLRTIRRDDLLGKTVLELGCNIGSHCFVATRFGALSARGVDPRPRLISAAARLNSFLAAPVFFRVHDLNPVLEDERPADTVFCFSVAEQLQTTEGLVQTLLRTTRSVLYFEGRAGARREDYGYLLRDEYFRSIESVGDMRGEARPGAATAPLFRCEIRTPTAGLPTAGS